MARILLADDDEALLQVLGVAIGDAGHEVVPVGDGRAAFEACERGGIDLLITDVNMPRLDGFALVRNLRARGDALPILVLTARDDEIDEALGLELGADDYVTKPFSNRVLLSRIAALLRRQALRRGDEAVAAARRIGELEIDDARLEVRWRSQAVETTMTELRLLDVLTRRPGQVFSRDALLERIRGDGSVVAPRIIDTYVNRLRRKLEALDPAFDRIETVIGAGYRWRDV
ncbi:MAG: response regulator transcription factor [Deltaproteobacteria bacterium]|nr:response regulator transcription factor [Deltaproteobacteria bacterium]